LLAKSRVFVTFLENQAPVRVGAALEALLHGTPLGERGLERPAQLFQVALLAVPPLLEIGRNRATALDFSVERIEHQLVMVDEVIEAGTQLVQLVQALD